MKKILLAGLCVWLAFGSAPPFHRVFAAQSITFKDVKDHWAQADIEEAVRRGIIEGFPDGTFRPDNIVTADQLLVMLLRAYSKTYATSKGDQVRFEQGFLQRLNLEYPGRLGAIQNALADKPFYFQKSETGYWAQPFVDFAYDIGYLTTFDAIFPKDYDLFQKPIKREQASYLLGMWFKGYENTFNVSYENFALKTGVVRDLQDFSRTPVSGYVATVLLSGVMRGNPNGNFYPHRYVTRAEAVAMVMRVRDPDRRLPFKPDLSEVCYSQTNDYDIHIFDDPTKCLAYQKIVELAREHVLKGYVQVGTLGVSVFANKEDSDENTRAWQLGLWNEAPSGEMGFVVGADMERVIRLTFDAETSLTYSKTYFEAAIAYLSGEDDSHKLLNAINEFQKTSSNDAASTIQIGKRTFKLWRTGQAIVVDYLYK